jgi:hypothetical protein
MSRSKSKQKIVTTPKLVIDSRDNFQYSREKVADPEVEFIQGLLFQKDQSLIQGSKFATVASSRNMDQIGGAGGEY